MEGEGGLLLQTQFVKWDFY